MNVVDSSGWLEYFAEGPNADYFAAPVQDTDKLIVPTITIYEVFKVVLRERGEDNGLQVVALMKQGTEIDLNSNIAIQAAKISFELKIPMAASIILATAQSCQATVWTLDSDFEGIGGVNYFSS